MRIELYDKKSNPEYADQVISLISEESEEIRKIGVDGDYVKKVLDSDMVLCVVAVEGVELIGAIVIHVSTEWFNPKSVCANDLLLWIKPENRGGTAFFRMLKCVEKISKVSGVNRLNINQRTGLDVVKTSKLFEKLGYNLIGFSSVKEL